MTGSAFSSAVVVLLALLLAAGCDRAGSAPAKSTFGLEANSRSDPMVAADPGTAASPAALYTADLTRAVAGEKKVRFPAGVGGIGGMSCSPHTLSGTNPASRVLTLTLPAELATRRHVLAVVTPERGLLEIYSPCDEDAAEAGDLLVPSDTISWSKARAQSRFTVGTDDLDGLRPGLNTPEVLFLEPGRYRFALINSIDAALLKTNGAAVRVTAACSVDCASQEAGVGTARL